jgi:hypothetical protein
MPNSSGYFSSTQTIQSLFSNFTTGSIVFQGTGTALTQDNTHLFWDDVNYRLGIGTNLPDSSLTISGNATTLPAAIAGSYNTIHTGSLDGVPNTVLYDAFGGVPQQVLRRADGTNASPSAVQSGDILGQYVFYGYGATAYQALGASKIVSMAAENFSDSTGAAMLQFFTRPSGTVGASSPRLTIDQNGGVTINGLTSASPVRSSAAGLLSNGPIVLTATTDVSGILPIANGGTNNSAAYTAGSVIFSNGSALTQNNSNLFWDNTNFRLGIGTATPTSLLQMVQNAAGTITANLTNSNASTSASALYSVTNQNGASGALTIFANNFVASYLSNATRLSGTNALWLASDVNNASGGTDPIVFSVGGYNNVTAQATTNGLTAINLTDTGIPASASGAPLTITSGQVLTYGVANYDLSSSSAITVSTTLAVIGGATVTPAAGTYLVIGSANITASSAGGNILTFQLYVGGTAVADTKRQAMPTGTAFGAAFQNMNVAFNKIVTVNGSQAIAAEAVSSAGTITVTGLNFDVVRLA